MARQSFTLREDTFEGGSYLQYYPSGLSASSSASAGAASATYLKADEIQIAAASDIMQSLSYFEGYAEDYGTVFLDWGMTLEEPGDLPTPYEVFIAYSRVGPPMTLPEGEVLIRTRNITSLTHTNIEDRWAYYTMFVRYRSVDGLDDYYEPIAHRSVLLPERYDSVDDLYARIPSWYQGLDEQTNGDLYKFLSIFGWDVDYIRTVLDYMISMKDPQIAEVSQLNNLARDLGIGLEAHELGADRLRKLLDAIGSIRRSKGTLLSAQEELSAITACNVEIYYPSGLSASAGATYEIKVFAQRCNLVKDPQLVNGVRTGLDGGSPHTESLVAFDVGYPDTGWTEEDEDYEVEATYDGEDLGSVVSTWVPADEEEDGELVLEPVSYIEGYSFDGGTPSDTGFIPLAGSKQRWVGYPDPDNGQYGVLETLDADVPVLAGDVFYFSIQTLNNDTRVQDSILAIGFYTSGGVTEGELITETTETTTINGVQYWQIEIPQDFNIIDEVANYDFATLSIRFEPGEDASKEFFNNFTNALLERSYIGEYFDGNTRLGGWLVDDMNSISDYRWRNPVDENSSFPGESFSVYSPNYQKTKAVVQRLLPSILPVTELVTAGVVYSNRPVTEDLKYALSYDVIPGF